MKAVAYRNPDPIDREDALQDIILETPKVEGRDLLVTINAVSVNPVDTKLNNEGQTTFSYSDAAMRSAQVFEFFGRKRVVVHEAILSRGYPWITLSSVRKYSKKVNSLNMTSITKKSRIPSNERFFMIMGFDRIGANFRLAANGKQE